MNKSPAVAFFLSFIPGAGHAYLRRYIRFIIYFGGFFGPLGLLLFVSLVNNYVDTSFTLFCLFVAAVIGFINMLDMVITLLKGGVGIQPSPYPSSGYGAGSRPGEAAHGGGGYMGEGQQPGAGFSDWRSGVQAAAPSAEQQQERTRVILLSIIPGLGHMNMGLMQRGITFLVSSIGLFAIIVFISAVMNSGAILTFLLALPVIWVYGIFDAISILNAKQRGETIQDKSLFEGIEAHIASGTKNKVLTTALAIFPGAGHLYLGLQKRGLQLMGGFLLAIYIMDTMRLSLFLFLLPLYWFFAFFDALQQVSRYERQVLRDEPILPMFVPYQRWLGAALLVFGLYFLVDRVLIGMISDYWWPGIWRHYQAYKYMFPTAVIAFVMIVLGMKLAFGSKSILAVAKPPKPTDVEAHERKKEGDGHE